MVRMGMVAVGVFSLVAWTAAPVRATDLNSPAVTPDQGTTMPNAGEFNNGPEGTGAALGVKGHVPSGSEFNNGPEGIGGTAPSVGSEETHGTNGPVPEWAGWGDQTGEHSVEAP